MIDLRFFPFFNVVAHVVNFFLSSILTVCPINFDMLHFYFHSFQCILISLKVSSLAHVLFGSIFLLSKYLEIFFLFSFCLISLCLENIFFMISILSGLLSFVYLFFVLVLLNSMES